MGKTITRQALYEAAWRQPISKLAKEFGVSDVGLRQGMPTARCAPSAKRLVGTKGRRSAGQPVARLPLPPRPPGLNFETAIGQVPRWGRSGPPEKQFLGAIPDLTTFDEPIEQVKRRIEAMIGRTAVANGDLDQTHPVVEKLLADDAARRIAAAGHDYVPTWDLPIYESALQQRRLHLVSAILATVARCGCTAAPRGQLDRGESQDDFLVRVGDRHVGLRVAVAKPEPMREGKSPSRPPTRIEVTVRNRTWVPVGTGDTALIREIAIILALTGEEDVRVQAVADHDRWLERRKKILDRRRREAEKAARRERDRLAEIERSRVERLLGDAGALRKAEAIRANVRDVRTAAPAVSDTELSDWANWALAQADRIDPVLTPTFRKDWTLS